ncbi:MAG: quinolinate synthase [Candidatus Diapherotrites archaeon]|uniref:Quinolinate synthase n=1 Tax=Candidatus Iainarchaeum sp. TaxID=3101447 RepID=A0A2D6LZT8_9ARCH|nr:quinolinate synthase [Candidatus Diapherotrites archaeon]|tara:strand:- start:17 stop:922 length:906 start_codon:yes stop_codon:yes gene_type:complete
MDLVDEIDRLKKEKNAVLLVHNYQRAEVQDVQDFLGDSLGLARKASETDADLIVFAGVDFMAEIAKILNPNKKVLITSKEACCPMAAMLSKEELLKAKEQHPSAKVILYVNSSAECKALADCCCTSANADKIVNAMDSDTILFGPDKNLVHYVQERSDKKIIPVPENGHCYVHNIIELPALEVAIERHPKATIIVHPECPADVQDRADYIASTSGMVKLVKELPGKEFIIGTEVGLIHRLQKENPEKKIFPAFENAICRQMKKTTLEDVYLTLKEERNEVQVPKDISEKAVKAINRMLELS